MGLKPCVHYCLAQVPYPTDEEDNGLIYIAWRGPNISTVRHYCGTLVPQYCVTLIRSYHGVLLLWYLITVWYSKLQPLRGIALL